MNELECAGCEDSENAPHACRRASAYTPTTEEVRDVYGYAQTYRDFDRWVADVIRKAKAEAWQEGYSDCMDYHLSNGLKGTETNPYTEEP